MFKNIIAPVQAWLLSRGQCVGCGTPFAKAKRETIGNDSEKVVCKCGRIYIYAKKAKIYRRALFEEI